MRYHVIPLELAEANALVDMWHRHHAPTIGHRFSLGVIDNAGTLHGAAIIGRPVARLAGSPRDVLEVETKRRWSKELLTRPDPDRPPRRIDQPADAELFA